MWWWLAACGGSDPCPLGEVRDGSGCVAYTAEAPVQGEVVPLRNGLTWQWQITGVVDTSYDVDVYDVDLFQLTPAVEQQLHADGRVLVCYFSAGSFEPWTPDADRFPASAIGRALEGWPDERWLDPMDPTVRSLLLERLDLAVEKGCDGVEPDNVTAFDTRSGFPVNATEQLSFNRFLADAAHERDLAVALKNDVDQIPELVDWFDFTVNEECAAFDECPTLQPFIDADRAVLHAEYVDRWRDAPDRAARVCGILPGLSTIVKSWDLGAELLACD